MYEYETIDDVLKDINETDANKLKQVREKGDHEEEPYQFNSVQIADLDYWARNMEYMAKTYTYPADSASQDFVDIVNIHLNARFSQETYNKEPAADAGTLVILLVS